MLEGTLVCCGGLFFGDVLLGLVESVCIRLGLNLSLSNLLLDLLRDDGLLFGKIDCKLLLCLLQFAKAIVMVEPKVVKIANFSFNKQ